MDRTRIDRAADWIGRTIGGAVGAGLLAVPGVYVGQGAGNALCGDGCLGMFVGVAVATALGMSVGGSSGAALAPVLLFLVRRLRRRAPAS